MSTEQALYDTIISTQLISDGGTAATEDSAECWIAPAAGRIISAGIVPTGAVAANDTNYATFNILNGATVMATASTTTTDMGTLVKDTAYALTVSTTAASRLFTSGDSLTVDLAKVGTGVAINAPAWFIVVAYGR